LFPAPTLLETDSPVGVSDECQLVFDTKCQLHNPPTHSLRRAVDQNLFGLQVIHCCWSSAVQHAAA